MTQFKPLPEDAVVYRALLRKQWISEDTARVKADAYFLRDSEPGLSVHLASVCSPEQCRGKNLHKTRNPFGLLVVQDRISRRFSKRAVFSQQY